MSDAGSSVAAASEPIYSLPHTHLHHPTGSGRERQRKNSHGSCRSDRAGSVASSTKSSASHHFHKQLQVTYKTKKTTTGLFKKKNTVVDSGSFRKNSAG